MAATQTGAGVTPSGTSYRTFMETVPGAGTVRWGVPTDLIGTTDIPGLCVYTHGAGGGSDQFQTMPAWAGIRNYLIDSGVVWVEGTGGGTQPWNNAASRSAYVAATQHLLTLFAPKALFGLFRSMGGLVGQWLLTRSPDIAPLMKGAMINSGVQDLMWAYRSGNWTAAMNSAWGVSSYAQFEAAAASVDPMGFPSTAWRGKAVLQLVGTADTLVPPDRNGLAIRPRYASQITNPDSDINVRPGGDHSADNGSYWQTAAMAAFVDLMLGKTPTPPEDPFGFLRIRREAIFLGGDWRRMSEPTV